MKKAQETLRGITSATGFPSSIFLFISLKSRICKAWRDFRAASTAYVLIAT